MTEVHRINSVMLFIDNRRAQQHRWVFYKYNDSIKQTFSWFNHNSLKESVCGIILINKITSNANIWAVRIFTKLLLSNSVAGILVLALTFLHLVNSMLESMPQCHSAQIYSVMNLLQIHLKTYYVPSIYLSNVFIFYIPKLGVLIASNWLPNQN